MVYNRKGKDLTCNKKRAYKNSSKVSKKTKRIEQQITQHLRKGPNDEISR